MRSHEPSDHDGYILLAIEDVSEERAARAESKRNWQLTQSIVDTIRDPLVVLEHDTTVGAANKAFLTILGRANRRRIACASPIKGPTNGMYRRFAI